MKNKSSDTSVLIKCCKCLSRKNDRICRVIVDFVLRESTNTTLAFEIPNDFGQHNLRR